jgi:predicted peroxiredoxin
MCGYTGVMMLIIGPVMLAVLLAPFAVELFLKLKNRFSAKKQSVEKLETPPTPPVNELVSMDILSQAEAVAAKAWRKADREHADSK